MTRNKFMVLIGLFCICSAHADTIDYIDMQLDAQIQDLISRRDKLKSDLEACEKNTKGYKIAGIATLGATGVGVYGNIALHNEIKKIEQSKNGGIIYSGAGIRGSDVVPDTNSQEERDESSCNQFAQFGIPLPDECKK